ncbi:hypothetical protein Thivi_3792 [Thiocystis violascens DSM 198]|uniref:Uncharacterized protein n=1 Tax=Thiocystis violascens (strain ATCC 17096 / DSM 198 / 6111) TaxID=765911 RepID=I3YF67_THIV6|nr:hypothetical protein Thivi_3792 [Thiocystis violascens DSM 198]
MNGFMRRGPDFPFILREPQDEREILRVFAPRLKLLTVILKPFVVNPEPVEGSNHERLHAPRPGFPTPDRHETFPRLLRS